MRQTKILIVEDNPTVRQTLVEWLSLRFPGCRIKTAPDGETAVNLAGDFHPDILLVDIRLPGINGLETLRRMKRVNPQVKAIVVSIHEDPNYQAEALDSGAIAFLPKHKMYTDLSPLLRTLIHNSKSSQPLPYG